MHNSQHELLALEMLKDIFKNGIKINTKQFVLGNMLPDKGSFKPYILHTKRLSLHVVAKMIQELAHNVLYTEISPYEISLNFGIICHFISDYFCLAHNKIKYYNPINHKKYERELKQHHVTGRYMRDRMSFSDLEHGLHSLSHIKDWINNIHHQYFSDEHSPTRDLNYAIAACSALADSIFKPAENKEVELENTETALAAI